jgi:hypothetical protein
MLIPEGYPLEAYFDLLLNENAYPKFFRINEGQVFKNGVVQLIKVKEYYCAGTCYHLSLEDECENVEMNKIEDFHHL